MKVERTLWRRRSTQVLENKKHVSTEGSQRAALGVELLVMGHAITRTISTDKGDGVEAGRPVKNRVDGRIFQTITPISKGHLAT